MRQGIGETFTLNIIIIFIFIVFGLLAATLSYYKAFKMNSQILNSIEKYEGYNSYAQKDINGRILPTLGYLRNDVNCSMTRGEGTLVSNGLTSGYAYCVYYYENDTGGTDKNKKNEEEVSLYSNYAVVTYIYVDLPLISNFKVPVFTKGERIYNFSKGSVVS